MFIAESFHIPIRQSKIDIRHSLRFALHFRIGGEGSTRPGSPDAGVNPAATYVPIVPFAPLHFDIRKSTSVIRVSLCASGVIYITRPARGLPALAKDQRLPVSPPCIRQSKIDIRQSPSPCNSSNSSRSSSSYIVPAAAPKIPCTTRNGPPCKAKNHGKNRVRE